MVKNEILREAIGRKKILKNRGLTKLTIQLLNNH